MTFHIKPSKLACAAGVIALVGTAGPMGQAAAEVDFSGKRINVIITSTPGGGTSGTTRLVGRFMEKYLPGQPEMTYRHMPGGHGSKALTYFHKQVKPDGLTWTGASSSNLDPNNLRREVFDYDPRDFEFIGGVMRGGSIVVMRKSKLADLKDGSAKPAVMGTLDGSRSWAQLGTWGADALDWNLRFVVGYPGTPSLVLASRRGEIDSMGTSNIEHLRSLFKTGEFVGFSQIGQTKKGKVVRREGFEDVPTIVEQMEAANLTGLAKEAFDFWVKLNQVDKWYALPPKTPKEIRAAYREAWEKISEDPEFIRLGKAQFSQAFSPMTGQDMLDIVKVTAYPKEEYLDYLSKMKVRHGLPAHGLSDEERMKLAEKLGGMKTVETTLNDVKRGGRWLHFKNGGESHKTKVSSSRTKVVIAGKETKRKNLKAGMKCKIKYLGDGNEARLVDCQ